MHLLGVVDGCQGVALQLLGLSGYLPGYFLVVYRVF